MNVQQTDKLVQDSIGALGGKVNGNVAKLTTNVDELAREITARDHFAVDAGQRLYLFKGGVFRPTGERFIRHRVKELYESWGLAAKWSAQKASEVVEFIRVDRPDLWTELPVELLNVKNGILNVRTRELLPHRHDFLSAALRMAALMSVVGPVWKKMRTGTTLREALVEFHHRHPEKFVRDRLRLPARAKLMCLARKHCAIAPVSIEDLEVVVGRVIAGGGPQVERRR